MIVWVMPLLKQRCQNLLVRGPGAGIGDRTIVFDRFMQSGQCVIGHHRVHVMIQMVIHVPVQETKYRVHHHGAAVEPVVKHVFWHARVLRQAEEDIEPGAIEGRQSDEQQRKQTVREPANQQ